MDRLIAAMDEQLPFVLALGRALRPLLRADRVVAAFLGGMVASYHVESAVW